MKMRTVEFIINDGQPVKSAGIQRRYYLRQGDTVCTETGGKKTIKQFNFSLYRGECVGITGGEDLQRKLLMELLAGIEEKTSGEICCKGKSIKKHSLYEMRRRGIVYLPNTEDALIDHMKYLIMLYLTV